MNQRRDRKRERPDIVSFFSCCCHEREEGKKRGGLVIRCVTNKPKWGRITSYKFIINKEGERTKGRRVEAGGERGRAGG